MRKDYHFMSTNMCCSQSFLYNVRIVSDCQFVSGPVCQFRFTDAIELPPISFCYCFQVLFINKMNISREAITRNSITDAICQLINFYVHMIFCQITHQTKVRKQYSISISFLFSTALPNSTIFPISE